MKAKKAKKKGNAIAKAEKFGRKEYEAKLAKLHEELVDLQQSVTRQARLHPLRGRDTAGKGGTIRRSPSA
jgi:polyphosphate kinase 2 (PPK2 family)